jgi:protein O-mannosyl-transferase
MTGVDQQVNTEAPQSRGLLFSGTGRLRILVPALLGLAGACLYWPGLFGPLLLDDVGNLARIAGIEPSLQGLFWGAFGNPSGPLSRPVTNLTFALNFFIAGHSVAALKLTNLLLHLATGWLVFVFSKQLFMLLGPQLGANQARLAAVLAACYWIAHPMQVSTVLYVVQRMSILAGFFTLLALCHAVRCMRPGSSPRGLPHRALDLAIFILLACAATLSKENGALVFPLLAAIVYIAVAAGRPLVQWRMWAVTGSAFTLAGLLYLLYAWETLTNHAGRPFSLLERIVTQPYVLGTYLRDIALPNLDSLALFRDDTLVRDPSSWLNWSAAIGLVSIPLGALALAKRAPILAMTMVWFGICHSMESTVLPLELAFEHRNYLAILGPAVLLAYLPFAVGRAYPNIKSFASIAALAFLVILGALTRERADRWSTESSFALTEVASRPRSLRAQNLAAVIENRRGDLDGPIARASLMHDLAPQSFLPHALDMDIACAKPTHQVNWKEAIKAAIDSPSNSDVLGHFNHITLKVMHGHCSSLSDGLDGRLEELVSLSISQGLLADAQYYLVLRAALAEPHNPSSARQLLHAAVALNPRHSAIWERIVIFELAQRNPFEAQKAIRELEKTLPSWDPAWHRIHSLSAQAEAMDQQSRAKN